MAQSFEGLFCRAASAGHDGSDGSVDEGLAFQDLHQPFDHVEGEGVQRLGADGLCGDVGQRLNVFLGVGIKRVRQAWQEIRPVQAAAASVGTFLREGPDRVDLIELGERNGIGCSGLRLSNPGEEAACAGRKVCVENARERHIPRAIIPNRSSGVPSLLAAGQPWKSRITPIVSRNCASTAGPTLPRVPTIRFGDMARRCWH